MKRETAGAVLLVLGALVLALGLWSSVWLVAPPTIDDYGRARAVVHGSEHALGRASFIAGVIAALLALPMAVTGARRLCGLGIVAAAATLLGVIGLALDTGVAIGPGAFAAATGSLLVLAGAMLAMAPAMPPQEPPPHDGRRLVYDARGTLVRIEQWAGGGLQSSRAVGRDGLVMDEPAPPKP